MSKFLLLNPLDCNNFSCTQEEMLESLEEFGISYISSLDTKGQVMYYAVSSTKELMERMCTEVSLDGSIIEFTSIYDQKIED
jgi:hypothetical protein